MTYFKRCSIYIYVNKLFSLIIFKILDMNSTQFNRTVIYFNESFSIYLLINIITMVSSCIGILFSLLFISIIVYNRSLHTLANILTLNSTVAILSFI